MHTTLSPQKKSIRAAKEIRKRIKEKDQQSSNPEKRRERKKRNEKKREMASWTYPTGYFVLTMIKCLSQVTSVDHG